MSKLRLGDIEYPSLEGKVSDGEWNARVELAALHRLVDLYGWNDLQQAPLSARIPDEPHYLFNADGLLFSETTASSLVKIDIDGNIVGDTPFTILQRTWFPMKAVHAVREDANFVIHSHDDHIAAISAREEGLLPISQTGAFIVSGGLAYHPYDGVETFEERIPSLQKSLGQSRILMLRNHGAVVVGETAWGAFGLLSSLFKACHTQVLAGRGVELIHLGEDILAEMLEELIRGPAVGNNWAALLRKLDRIDPSYKQ